jgi:hypothetical protein
MMIPEYREQAVIGEHPSVESVMVIWESYGYGGTDVEVLDA